MDVQSGIFMVLSTLALMLLLALLISILIKPARRLKVTANYKSENEKPDKSIVEIRIENVGKRPMNIVYIYVRFCDRLSHENVMISPTNISCKLPYFIEKKEIINCNLDIGGYLNSLKEKSFDLRNIKISIANSDSMEYISNSLDV